MTLNFVLFVLITKNVVVALGVIEFISKNTPAKNVYLLVSINPEHFQQLITNGTS
ncbi:hypothetical protein SBF1_1570008 [Candidatus Desulfosporosinus infrequens]|uniref:Uncharacterized protein n=1 Tax=Candidatus Desulfosporosinus infrequens TaxID=2043169 RepID=A0A2U3K8K3_9FIRM|nr:hypothetical protein SBF1_1570008 [Candidatus Desulfosporosinus infrequens]